MASMHYNSPFPSQSLALAVFSTQNMLFPKSSLVTFPTTFTPLLNHLLTPGKECASFTLNSCCFLFLTELRLSEILIQVLPSIPHLTR